MTVNSMSLNFQRISRDFADFERSNAKRIKYRPITSATSDDAVSTSNLNNFWHAFASLGFVSDSWAFLFQPKVLTVALMLQCCIRLSVCLSVCRLSLAKRCVLPKNCLKNQIEMAYRESNSRVTDDVT